MLGNRVRLPESARPWPLAPAFAETCLAERGVECRVCGEKCETRAIRFRPRLRAVAAPVLDAARCSGCGACVVAEEEVGRVGDVLMAASLCSGVITAALVYQHEVADPDETITVDSSAPPSAPDTFCTKESQP